MGIFRWLNRLAGRIDRKIEPTAATMAGGNASATVAPVAVSEIQKEEAEETEASS